MVNTSTSKLCCRCREIKPIAEFGTGHSECRVCQDYYRIRSEYKAKLLDLGEKEYQTKVLGKLILRLTIAQEILAKGVDHEYKRGRKPAAPMDKAES